MNVLFKQTGLQTVRFLSTISKETPKFLKIVNNKIVTNRESFKMGEVHDIILGKQAFKNKLLDENRKNNEWKTFIEKSIPKL